MHTWIAFLRGINVGGNAMLSMKDLAALCTNLGFEDVRTYLNSGNLIFRSSLSEAEVHKLLEMALSGRIGKEIGVVVRSPDELERIITGNPFPEAVPARIGVLLGSAPVPDSAMAGFATTGRETVVRGKREVYIHYPDGMGRSRLKIPVPLRNGTVRNINTLTGLVNLTTKN